MSDDDEVLERSVDEPAVFAELFDRHSGMVHRYVARRIGVGVADDILSETFLVAFEQRERFDPSLGSARPWLLGIATLLMKRHARLEARAWRGMVAGTAAQIVPDAIELANDRVDAARMSRKLAAALRSLPARDRDTLLLYAWGDLDYEGVAAALEVPVGTVRSRLNRVRRVLRAAAGRSADEEPEMDHGRVDPAPQRA
ncbi:sigma-70 family RNA polymerase sigma factor [Agromyces sp. CCNWLW213]|uniref:RNA polymerase sigma factor n=2 Tax=unclassified Agromyces TaxID=2639701 RepID=UPI003076550C